MVAGGAAEGSQREAEAEVFLHQPDRGPMAGQPLGRHEEPETTLPDDGAGGIRTIGPGAWELALEQLLHAR